MVLTSKSNVLTAEDRTICDSVQSLETKLLLIGIGLPTIAHSLLNSQLGFAEIINVHGPDQLNGDYLKREKITSESLTTSPTRLIQLANDGNLIPLLIVANSNFQPLLM
jgi:hypothetical protein